MARQRVLDRTDQLAVLVVVLELVRDLQHPCCPRIGRVISMDVYWRRDLVLLDEPDHELGRRVVQ